jgi:hypothetical protein
MIAIYGVNMTAAIFSQFSLPAELALLPDIAGQTHLVTANALFQFSMLAGEGLGIIVLSPLVIKLAGIPTVGLIGTGLFLLAFVLVAALPRTRPAAVEARSQTDKTSLWADLRAGWRTIAQDRRLSLVAIQATVAATLLLVLITLLPGLVSRHWGLNVEDAPILMLPGGLGFVLGTSLLSRWEKQLSRATGIGLGLAGMGAGVGLLGAFSGENSGHLWLIVLLIALVGLSMSLVVVPARTILQERPPAAMRGRVIAAQLALANAAAILPLLMGGALADSLGIRPVLGALSLVALGAGAIGLHQARA